MAEKEKKSASWNIESVSAKIGYEEMTSDHKEKVVMFKQKSTKLEKLLSQLPNGDTTKTTSVLNAILREKGLGWANSAAESFAYFMESQNGPILILNTIADGNKNSKLGDIDSLLERIRIALEEGKALDRSNPVSRNIHKYSHLTSIYDSSLSEMEQTYQKDTNDIFRVMDNVKGVFSDETGRKIYEKMNANTRKSIQETYDKFLKDFQENPPKTEQEMRSFSMINNRFQTLINRNFDGGKSTTQDVAEFLWDRKGQMAVDAWHGFVGEVKGLAMSVLGIFLVFFALIMGSYNLVTDEKSRKNMMEKTLPSLWNAIKSGATYIMTNATNPEAVMKDFGDALKEKFDELAKLPHDQQAEAIGYFAGEIIGMLEGGLLVKGALKSKILRVKFSASVLERIPIGKVVNWGDLEKFIGSIDHIRFRKGLDSNKLLKMIEDVRLGKAKLSDIPDVGGIRGKVKELIEQGWKITKPSGIEKIAAKTEVTRRLYSAAAKEVEGVQNKMSHIFEKGLNGKLLAAYDAFDAGVTKVLGGLGKVGAVAKKPLEIAGKPFAAVAKEFSELKQAVLSTDFPKKAEALQLLATMEKHVGDAREFLQKERHILPAKDGAENLTKKLSKKELEELAFFDGIGKREVMENGVKKYEVYDHTGKLIGGKRFEKVPEIRNGVAFIEDAGGVGILRMNGTWEVPIQKGVFQIQQMESGAASGYILGLRDEAGNVFFRFSENGIIKDGSRRYEFFANLDQGMGVVSAKSGKWSAKKYLLDITGEKPIPLRLPPELEKNVQYMQKFGRNPIHVDNFTKEWVAAVRLPDGSWSVMDREGKYVWRKMEKNAGVNTAETELEALEKYYREKNIGIYENTPDLWGSKIHANELNNIPSVLVRKCGGAENLHHTGIKNLYAYTTKEGKTEFLNAANGKIIAVEHSHVQLLDAQHGFLRFKHEWRWGIVDMDGNVLLRPKHDTLSILDEKKRIFEAGNILPDGTLKKGIIEAGKEEAHLPVKYDYVETLAPGKYRGVNYKPGTLERTSVSKGVVDIRSEAIKSVGSRSDNLADFALLSELKGKVTQTKDMQHGLELYTNPKLKAFFDGDIPKIFSLFDFSSHKTALEKALRPFRMRKVFQTIQEALAKELSKETSSSKNRHQLMKLLAIRAGEMTEALREQAKAFPKDAKRYSFDTLSSNLQQIG